MGERKLRLGFDLDGVLYPWHEIIYGYMQRTAGEKRSFSDFWKHATQEVFTTKMGKFWLENNLFYVQRDIKPEYLDLLNDLGDFYDLYYITARVKTSWNATRYWFDKNKLPFRDNLYMTDDKKLPLVLSNEIDIFIEDRIKHIIELKNYTDVILVKRPWNEEVWDEVPSVDSILELPEFLGITENVAN